MVEYITEIKRRFIAITLTWFSVNAVGFYYGEIIFFLFLESEIFSCYEFKVGSFVTTDVLEVSDLQNQIILSLNFQVLFLCTIYHSFKFFSPGFSITEYRFYRSFLRTTITIWFLSAILAKYFLIPHMWWSSYESLFKSDMYGIAYELEVDISRYVKFYIEYYCFFLVYGQSVVFLIYFFESIYSGSEIREFRRLYYYFLFVYSMAISPSEILVQISASCFLIFIFELRMIWYLLKKTKIYLKKLD